jgi:hypothetical protein
LREVLVWIKVVENKVPRELDKKSFDSNKMVKKIPSKTPKTEDKTPKIEEVK